MIEVYSSLQTCPPCQELHKFLKENNIEFNDYDITAEDPIKRIDAKKKHYAHRVKHYPTIVIDGYEIIGFDKERISQLLKL